MMRLTVPISPGELIDKITILRIKAERITDAGQLRNVRRELQELEAVVDHHIDPDPDLVALWQRLAQINGRLWTVEDDLRAREAEGDFGPDFVRLARSVYQTNDERAEVKRQINMALGSDLIEEKSYHGSQQGKK